MSSENTLRTLKDLDLTSDIEQHLASIPIERLKAEAVKWVKKELIYVEQENIVDWIKHFFNLTEEDLEEQS